MRWLLLAVLVFATTTSTVSAQEPAEPTEGLDSEARALFEAGSAAMTEGRYEAALEYFQRAHSLSPKPRMLFNIGAVSERLRQREQALRAYREFLRQVPDTDKRAEVERRIQLLEQDLAAQRRVEEAANEANPDAPPDSEETGEPELGAETAPASKPLYKEWWLWTIVGVVVLGSAIAIGVAASSGGMQDPLEGYGGVIMTLR